MAITDYDSRRYRANLVFLSSREIRLEVGEIRRIDKGKITLLQVMGKKLVSPVMTIDFNPREVFHTFVVDDNRIFDVYSYEYVAQVEYEDETILVDVKPLYRVPTAKIRGMAKKVKRDFQIVAKRFNGSGVRVFKKMKLQQKCEECWDEDLESSSNSSCEACGGLGRVAYYSNPIETFAGAVGSTGDALTMSNVGQVSLSGSSRIAMLQDITLFTDDIFFYKTTGKWFIVNSVVSQATLQNIPTLQTLLISELPTGSSQISVVLKQWKIDIENNKGF